MTQTAVPLQSQYWTYMVEWFPYLSTYLAGISRAGYGWLGSLYYDGKAGAYKIKDYLLTQGASTTAIDTMLQQAFDGVATDYVIPILGRPGL
ncbi:MAG: hypothetical protein C0467_26190 [Planctomycetaceae bacterium]|nr:hypothetical protein [Planctomycetaceae bacterium]